MALREDDVSYEKPPGHVETPDGRILVATPTLLARSDMKPVFDWKPKAKQAEVKKPEVKEFSLTKATKQEIVNEASERYGAELSMDSTAKELKEQFKEIMNASDSDS